MPVDPASVPDFDDLPKVKDMPQGCAWGIFDHSGKKDLVGTLNFLTPDIVKAAAAEVQDGVSVSLNWPLNALSQLGLPGRNPTKHNVLYLPESMPDGVPPHAASWDDELSFNTQNSSQWDSLCHVQHLPSGLAYNGFKPTKENLAVESTAANTQPTLDHWHEHGGIAARGVLLDYKRYAEEKGISFHAWGGDRLTVKQLEACAQHFGVEFRYGDVLIVRTGATDILANPTPEDLEAMEAHRMSGIHGSVEAARWIWNKRFAAVASDALALEAFPPIKPDGTEGGLGDLVLHHYLLSLFGMSIGELWDLSRLSEYCARKKRYSFMLTSIPLNHPCLIGSPPNALAIL
ncbi:cyclase protein [Purpureocillium lavendulum]|uniref:Cyclase protein n=1 Tax=Purpureocillium lavendulum TaxID=1247861 RepID=A0AB34G0H5_9HYPO|nr:cyclase protein [Purpureocillium lavendulum]